MTRSSTLTKCSSSREFILTSFLQLELLFVFFQSGWAEQGQLHGQQKHCHLLVAYPSEVRIRRPVQVRSHEAAPRGDRADNDRPVFLPILRRGGCHSGMTFRRVGWQGNGGVNETRVTTGNWERISSLWLVRGTDRQISSRWMNFDASAKHTKQTNPPPSPGIT